MIRPWSRTVGSRAAYCRALSWIFVGALLVGTAVAQSPDNLKPLETSPTADQEPITPIPLPPAADLLKLALGERLFSDTRLSAGGNFACSSCHDIRTNGAGGNAKTEPAIRRIGRTVARYADRLQRALSFRLTWQGRFRTLATQAEASHRKSR